MSEREWRLFLNDIEECCSRILAYTGGLSSAELFADPKTIDAVMRNLAVIGEATKRIPRDFRKQHPEIPWQKMAGLRDIVVHDYFGIDTTIIWDVVTDHIPALHKQIASLNSG